MTFILDRVEVFVLVFPLGILKFEFKASCLLGRNSKRNSWTLAILKFIGCMDVNEFHHGYLWPRELSWKSIANISPELYSTTVLLTDTYFDWRLKEKKDCVLILVRFTHIYLFDSCFLCIKWCGSEFVGIRHGQSAQCNFSDLNSQCFHFRPVLFNIDATLPKLTPVDQVISSRTAWSKPVYLLGKGQHSSCVYESVLNSPQHSTDLERKMWKRKGVYVCTLHTLYFWNHLSN
jgi:hypothetical protein